MARTRFIALFALLALALPLRAQESKDPALEEARQHAAKAKTHYQLGEFEAAANEYILVYRLRPIPILLYNIAQAYRQAGQYEKAKQFYKSYLRESPDQKVAIEKTLTEIDELLAKEKKTRDRKPTGVVKEPVPPTATAKVMPLPATEPPVAQEKPLVQGKPPASTVQDKPATVVEDKPATVVQDKPAPAVPPSPAVAERKAEPPKLAVANPPAKPAPFAAVPNTTRTVEKKEGRDRTVAWVLAGTSAALLGGGGIFFLKAKSADNSLQNTQHTRAEADQLISQSNSNHGASALLLIGGLAVAATSAVFFLLP